MCVPKPHFLLYSEVARQADEANWRFVLESVDGADKLEAAAAEPDVQGERLELLAVVRGLEALDQPSLVTLVTASKYVSRGFRFGLEEWRANGWQWERFGEMVPIKNLDLWQRVDRSLRFHRVEWGGPRLHGAHAAQTVVAAKPLRTTFAHEKAHNPIRIQRLRPYRWRRRMAKLRRAWHEMRRAIRTRLFASKTGTFGSLSKR